MHKRLILAAVLAVSIWSFAQAQDTSCGIIWYPPIQLSNDTINSAVPQIAASDDDTVHVTWLNDHPTRGMKLLYSRIVRGIVVETKDLLKGLPQYPWSVAYPVITAGDNRVWIFFTQPTGDNDPLYLCRSSDGGVTWNPPVAITSEVADRAYPPTQNSSTVAVLYPRFQPVRVLRSTNNGATWTRASQDLSDHDARIALTPGKLHVVKRRWVPPAIEIEYRRSTNLGDSWEKEEIISDIDGYWSDLPTIAGSESECGTELLAAWRDTKYGIIVDLGASVISRGSLTGGTSWGNEGLLTSEPRGFNPTVAVNGTARAVGADYQIDFWTFHVSATATNQSLTFPDPLRDLTPLTMNAGGQAIAVSSSAAHLVWHQKVGSTFRIFYRRGEFIQHDAQLSLPTGALDLDSAEVNKAHQKSVTITNTGTDPLVIGTIIPDHPESFRVWPESVVVSPGESVSVVVNFTPKSLGVHTGKVIFYHNGQSSPDCFTVSGRGVYTNQPISYSPAGVWQMVSLPVRPAQSYTLPSLFSYEGNYQRQSSMTFGKGYWAKPAGEEKVYRGLFTTRDSIPVQAGWNMIGSVSEAVLTSTITSSPPAMSVSSFYSYNPTKGGYTASDFIEPGRAYWVRTTQAGKLYLSEEATTRFGTIRIDRSATEQPPTPPPEATNIEHRTSDIPQSFGLAQNYPNPFNPITSFKFQVSRFTMVSLSVYDVLGREVARLVEGDREPGYYEVRWDARDLPGGVYYVRMRAGEFTETRATVVMK